MADRVGRSFADLTNFIQQLLAGLGDNKDDPKQSAYTQELTPIYQNLRTYDARHQKAKAELHTVSQLLQDEDKKARELLSKVIAYLESEHGKSSPQLEKYGITKRQTATPKVAKKAKTPTQA